MLIIGMALHVLIERWRLDSRLRVTATFIGLVLLVMIPPYYPRHASGTPLNDNFRVLNPFSSLLRRPDGRIVLGDYDGELANYLRLPNGHSLDYGMLGTWNHQEELSDFFDRKGINVVYLQPRNAQLRTEPRAQQLLLQPESRYWQRLGQEATESGEWLLIRRERAGSECSVRSKP